MKILFIADTHIGGEHRWGVSGEQWDAPFREAMTYAKDNGINLMVIAGDGFEKRNPTTEEWRRFYEIVDWYGEWVLLITGNHDVGASATSVSTTEIATLALPRVMPASTIGMFELNRESPQIVHLPWPRPVDYLTSEAINRLDLEQQIHETRAAVMARLHEICSALDPTRPAVLTGHAMVAYGKSLPSSSHNIIDIMEDPVGPGLLLGKDIVLNFDELCNLPNIKSNVLLGHVHDAGAKGYIGSPQPTDFADTAPKTFTVLEFDEGADDVSKWTSVNYQTSLVVDEMTLREDQLPEGEGFWDKDSYMLHKVDIRRVKITTTYDSTLSEKHVRTKFDGQQDRLIVEITRERIERQRIVTDVPVAQMGAAEALAEWFMANNIEPEVAGRANALFLALEAE